MRSWVVALLFTAFASALLFEACTSDLSPPRSPGGESSLDQGGGETSAESPPGGGAPVNRTAAARSVHVTLGLPKDADDSDDALLDETAFLVSYSARLRGPNWVAWRLEAMDLGHVRRHDAFHPDALLPAGMYRVMPHDYERPYDCGHLCPFGDRSGTEESARRTFVMTNMEPQLHELNAGPWEKLEEYERARASRPGSVLYLVAGGVYGEAPSRIGHGVAVPRATFKIVVALEPGQGAKDVTIATHTVAVEMPNEAGIGRRSWQDFVTSIDHVEADTGYDFLTAVPEAVQAVLEAREPREL